MDCERKTGNKVDQMKNLGLLLKLRSWLKSGDLKLAGIITLLGQAQVWIATEDGMRIMALVAGLVGMTPALLTGWITSIVGLVLLWRRTNTETNLAHL